jgi:hypothetical protein
MFLGLNHLVRVEDFRERTPFFVGYLTVLGFMVGIFCILGFSKRRADMQAKLKKP